MKLAAKFSPEAKAKAKAKDEEYAALLRSTTLPLVISEEEQDFQKRVEKLLPETIKKHIQEITSITINGKEYDSDKSLSENNIKQGAFIVLTVKLVEAPAKNKPHA